MQSTRSDKGRVNIFAKAIVPCLLLQFFQVFVGKAHSRQQAQFRYADICARRVYSKHGRPRKAFKVL